jgi:hypothetical protein
MAFLATVDASPEARIDWNLGSETVQQGRLALQVQEVLKRDPHAGNLYLFRGRRGSFN